MCRPALLTTILMMLIAGIGSARADDLVLNGAAVFSQLSRDYYLGGLWLPQRSSSPDYITSADTARRMQLVVLAEHWSPRNWSRLWQNNIFINNESGSLPADVQQGLMRFTRLLRDDLKQGDEIRIEYQPAGNTRVLLNREIVAASPGPALFNALLNTWIGQRPPSREFRRHILGEGDSAARQRYFQRLYNHPVPLSRLSLFSAWQAAEEAERQAQARAAAAEKRRIEQQRRQQRQQRALEAEQAKQAEQARQEKRRAEQARAQAAAEQQAQEESIQAARDAAWRRYLQRQAALEEAQRQAAENQARHLVGQTSNVLGAGKSSDTLAQEQRYYLQLLQWRLQRATRQAVEYPGWARQFGEEGQAQIDFILSRDATVTDITPRDEQVADLLLAELGRAVKQAAASTGIPDELAGDQWPLSVSYHFSLSSDEQPSDAMPEAPPWLQRKILSPLRQEELAARYQQQLREQIIAAIRYPQAARILKKQGPVGLQLTIHADGRLQSVELTHPSAHRELNDALIRAVRDSAPFDPYPDGLSTEPMTLAIHSRFVL